MTGETTLSDRGFRQGTQIPATNGGHIRTYESSAATAPHVWVSVLVPRNATYAEGPTVEGHVHLTLADARRLHTQLGEIIDNHYQTQATTRQEKQ